MKRRGRREGPGVIARAIERQGDRIVAAIERASADAQEGRKAMILLGTQSLRAVLDETSERAARVPGNDNEGGDR
jgi:phosphate uptake regulator